MERGRYRSIGGEVCETDEEISGGFTCLEYTDDFFVCTGDEFPIMERGNGVQVVSMDLWSRHLMPTAHSLPFPLSKHPCRLIQTTITLLFPP